MPLKVRRLWISCLVFSAAASASAQQQQPQQTVGQTLQGGTASATAINPAQQKISRVRALIASRQFGAASSELEKIRKESGDESTQTVARTMLISIYLEQPDYKRATDLLEDSFKRNKRSKNGIDQSYLAVAGQFIKGAQLQLERYKRFGINISDSALTIEAANDLDKWRGMLEAVINQAKQLSVDSKQPAEALALLEDAATARGTLARDVYETARWKNEINDTREMMSNAQTKVAEVDENMNSTLVAANTPTAGILNESVSASTQTASLTRGAVANPVSVFEQKTPQVASGQSGVLSPTVTLPSVEMTTEKTDKPAETTAQTIEPKIEAPVAETAVARPRIISSAEKTEKTDEKAADAEKTAAKTENNGEPVKLGSLVSMATSKVNPTYPAVARTARIMGTVKVEVLLNEQGAVAEIRGTDGPQMLRRAAEDAVRRWKFRPTMRDGQAVKASGFVNFNFTL